MTFGFRNMDILGDFGKDNVKGVTDDRAESQTWNSGGQNRSAGVIDEPPRKFCCEETLEK